MPKICGITTNPSTVKLFMLPSFKFAEKAGFECACISSPDVEGRLAGDVLGSMKFIPVEIKWGFVSPIEVIKTVYKLYRVFKREKYDIVQYATMNAALCASIAAKLAKVPVRINLLWGLDYVMFSGIKRFVYYSATKLICTLSTHVQPDSRGNLEFGRANGLFTEANSEVLYNGSACGIDLSRFDINKRALWSKQVKDEVGLHSYKTVLGFVGTLYYDKGVNELFEAFLGLEREDIALVMVGNMTRTDTLNQDLFEKAKQCPHIYILGRKADPEKYYASFDYLVLPSYAEGFGMVVLEAAAVGTPTIVSNIKGPTDFVKDGVTGLVCQVRNADSLKDAIQKAIDMDNEDYRVLSKNAYEKVKNDFDSEVFKQKFVENRLKLYNNIKK